MQPDVSKISLPTSDEFKAFWKDVIQRAAYKDEKIVLLYEDSLVYLFYIYLSKKNVICPFNQIHYSKAIESINSVIENGQIINLFHSTENEEVPVKEI